MYDYDSLVKQVQQVKLESLRLSGKLFWWKENVCLHSAEFEYDSANEITKVTPSGYRGVNQNTITMFLGDVLMATTKRVSDNKFSEDYNRLYREGYSLFLIEEKVFVRWWAIGGINTTPWTRLARWTEPTDSPSVEAASEAEMVMERDEYRTPRL